MAISKRLRYEVLRRDNHACRYCGGAAPDVSLTVDHVVPVALGGTDNPENLATACLDCNTGKSSSNPDAPLVADVEQDALRWAAARERALALLAAEREKQDDYVAHFFGYWGAAAPPFAHLPPDFESSIVGFYESGLPLRELEYAIDVACSARHVEQRRRFKYMCGIAWRLIEKINSATEEIARTEEADE